jgi:hypothetical protein
MNIAITVPEDLVAVSNGRLEKTDHDVAAKTKTYHWKVINPINNYGVNANIGNYVNVVRNVRRALAENSISPIGCCRIKKRRR